MNSDALQSTKPRLTARRLQLLSVLFGLLVSSYLSYLKWDNAPSICIQNGPFNCDGVLNSIYSEIGGIPIAYLGWLVYVLIGLAVLFEERSELLRAYSRLIVFGIALFAWLFSMWLVYVQFGLIGALCQWCLMHEANFTILFIVICYRLYQEMTAD